jgi:hypothetical protein
LGERKFSAHRFDSNGLIDPELDYANSFSNLWLKPLAEVVALVTRVDILHASQFRRER